MKFSDNSGRIKFFALLAVCLGLYITQFASILKYATNIPYYDEWEALTDNGFLANPTLTQFFSQHNEHRIVTTKLLTFALYCIDGWNLIHQQAINFVIYGILLLALGYILNKCVPQMPKWLSLAFLLFALSAVAWENHFWGFQSQFHFSLLFLILSVFFLFNEYQSWKNLVGGIFFAWLTVYSLSSGVVEILTATILYTLFKLLRIREQESKKNELFQLTCTLFFIGTAFAIYFIDYSKPSEPGLTFPFEKEFWIYFFNLFSNGFGFNFISIIPGIFLLIFVLFPVIGIFLKEKFQMSSNRWTIAVLIISICAALGVIAMGRAGFHSVEQSKSPRYCEIVVMLIPLSTGMWMLYLDQHRQLRKYLIGGFWIFCAVSSFKQWNFNKIYRENALGRITGRTCVERYYAGQGAADCQTIYPVSIENRLRVAEKLKISFAEEITENFDRPN